MFEFGKVKLRAYKKEDVPQVTAAFNDWGIIKNMNNDLARLFKLEDEEKWYENLSKDIANHYSFAIENKESKELLGGCGYFDVSSSNRIATIGLWLSRAHWNKGYGTDAIYALLEYLFYEMNLQKVSLYVYSFNKNAIHVYEKCGFKIEGIAKRELFREGAYHDIHHMAIFVEDWEKNVKAAQIS